MAQRVGVNMIFLHQWNNFIPVIGG
jgi:hypothetical protein